MLAMRLGLAALALGLLGSAWLVDPGAAAGFDAPKRLAATLGAVLAGLVLCLLPGVPRTLPIAPAAWRIGLLAALSALGVLGSTLAAAQPGSAWESLRTMALYALWLPIGASALLQGAAGRGVLRLAALAIGLNLMLSLLQAAGLALPFTVVREGSRYATGALLGNEGYVALAAALLAAAGLALVLYASGRGRAAGLLALVLGVATIAINRQATAAAALALAGLALVLLRMKRPRWLGLAAMLLAGALLAAAVAPLRAWTWAALPGLPVDRVQQLTTHRLGAWAAALQMVEARPLVGFGPGSYAAQALPQRFAAELQLGWRLPPAAPATGFAQAHNDYLQLAAEAGLPTLAAALGALALLLAGLAQRTQGAAALEPALLFGVLAAGAIMALAWFPLQIPLLAIVLLLAAGRGWRLLADPEALR